MSLLTIQSVQPLLDDASVKRGHNVLDLASGAGYVAAVAAQSGAHSPEYEIPMPAVVAAAVKPLR
jgi:predicted nicotinamide N-methyase